MYSLLLFGRFQIYSSEKLAQKNACRYLMKQLDNGGAGAKSILSQDFKEHYQREDYAGALDIWNNQIVPFEYRGSSVYNAWVSKVEVDQDFV